MITPKQHEPLVSIVMPAYNAERHIDAAIRSALDQTYTNFELLIVNDGSLDATEAKVLQYKDPRVRYFKQNNGGVSMARNTGISRMKGEYLCFLDADDWLPSNSLEARVNKFRNSESVSFVDGRVQIFSEDGVRTERTWSPDFTGKPLRLLLRLSPRCFFGPTWMIRMEPDRSYRFEEGLSHGEDLMFYIRIAGTGVYSHVDEVIYCYRNRLDSAMKNIQGLANGYRSMRNILSKAGAFSLWDRIVFEYKVRKITALSFFSIGKVSEAIRSLVQ